MSDDPRRREFLALAHPALAAAKGRSPTFPLRVVLVDADGDSVTLAFARHELLELGVGAELRRAQLPATNGADTIWPPCPPLRRIHRKLIEKATADPVTTRKLIGLAGYKVHTDSREAVTMLCRAKYLDRGPDGLVRGPRPL